MSRSQKKYYSSSSATYCICITQRPWTWLQSEGKTTSLWRNTRSEGKDSNKDNLSSVKYPSPWQFQVGRTQMSHYSCTAAEWEANKRHTTHLQRDRAQNKGSNAAPWAALEREPIWITVSSLCRKDYCPRTPFRQEGKLNGSNSQQEWRHFLCWSRWCLEVIFSYMFSKLWKESITFKGPRFCISCSLQKWRNRVSLWEKSTKTFH